MKKFAVIAFGMFLFALPTKAQTLESQYGLDSAQTILNASLYTEYWKQKNFEEALPTWRYVFLNAPAFQLNTYIRGEDIIEYMIQKTKKKEYVDTLMMIFDRRLQYMKSKSREGYVLGKKGMAQVRFSNGDLTMLKAGFDNLMKSYELEGTQTPPQLIHATFDVGCNLVKQNQLSKEEFVNLYMKFSAFADQRLASGDKGCDNFAVCKSALDAIFFDSGFADCNTLAELLTKRYEANQDSLPILKDISSILKRRECTDLPLFAAVAEKIYQKEPSAEAAYGLAMMFFSKQDFAKFEQYLKEAIDKCDDPKAKADYNYKLAQVNLSKKNYQQARRYALEALKTNPNLGSAYITIGLAYAVSSNDYEGDEFDKRTVFWAAVDKFVKAKQVDPSVAATANEYIERYSPHFPTKDEAFFRSITAGKNVKVGGWINETTTARFRD